MKLSQTGSMFPPRSLCPLPRTQLSSWHSLGQFPRLLSTQFQPHSCLTLVGSSLVLSESCHTALGFGRARETPVWGWAWGLSSISSGLAAAVCSVFPRGTGTRATPAYSSASWNSHSRSVSVKFLSHSCSHRCLQRTPCMLVLASQGIVHTAASLIHRNAGVMMSVPGSNTFNDLSNYILAPWPIFQGTPCFAPKLPFQADFPRLLYISHLF